MVYIRVLGVFFIFGFWIQWELAKNPLEIIYNLKTAANLAVAVTVKIVTEKLKLETDCAQPLLPWDSMLPKILKKNPFFNSAFWGRWSMQVNTVGRLHKIGKDMFWK